MNKGIEQQIFPLSNTQKTIGKRMLLSKRSLPCFYIGMKADITTLNIFRRETSKKLKAKISTNDIFFKAMSIAVAKYPLMAAKIEDQMLKIADTVNIGFAVSAQDDKLLVPVIKNTNNLSLSQISEKSRLLTNNAKSGRILPDQMSGACIALSSLGMFGLSSFIAILPPEMTSIIAIGKPADELEIKDGEITTRKKISLSLAADARIVSTEYGAMFLAYVVEMMENPEKLLENG